MAEQFPQKFGPYSLHQLIARGGMAEIYRATMPGIGGFEKTVAIKKILPHLTENEEFITMLIDEARIVVGLNHANVAQVYDLGCIDDTYYIAMEYVHGIDAATIIKETGKRGETVPFQHVTYIGAGLCMGLHVAHAATDDQGRNLNIVHRDVSPHNVLISFAGDVKVIDFGVAKARSKQTHTRAGVIKGKLLYMAPEQAMAKPIDGRADLFAAGLCMYKMMTQQLPFQGENEFQIYNQIMSKEILPPKTINPDVPDELDRIVMKLLARDPDERYQDGYSAKVELDRALHTLAPGYTPSRLSRYVEDNFSHIVQKKQEQARQQAMGMPAKMTPSSPAMAPAASSSSSQDSAGNMLSTAGQFSDEDFPDATVEHPSPFAGMQPANTASAGAGVQTQVRTDSNTQQPQQANYPSGQNTPAPNTPLPSGFGPSGVANSTPSGDFVPPKTDKKPPFILYGVILMLVVILLLIVYSIFIQPQQAGEQSQLPTPTMYMVPV